jgi:hypothetical protein
MNKTNSSIVLQKIYLMKHERHFCFGLVGIYSINESFLFELGFKVP